MARRKTPPPAYPSGLPGVTISWLAKANDISVRTARLRNADQSGVVDFIAQLTPEQACAMTLVRPTRGMIPHWGRLAMVHYRLEGYSVSKVAEMFGCSRNSVVRATRGQTKRGYQPLSGRRALTSSQAAHVP